ncbi:MAG: response regulator [Burkholderiales bacterium]
MEKLKVLLADDHAIIRDALKQILGDTEDLLVAGEAANGTELMQRVRAEEWDVLVLDISMPGCNGLELIRMVKDVQPTLPILILSMHGEERYAVRALHSGASGYLTKESDGEVLVAAIRKVVGGGVYVSQNVVEMMLRGKPSNHPQPHELLSDREFQVFSLLVAGNGLTEIAAMLGLSVKTVGTHKTHIFKKMDLTNHSELIRYAVSHHLSELSEF